MIFGELLDWYDIEVTSAISSVVSLFKEVKELERNLFTGYVSFILAKTGFYNLTCVDLYPWDIKDRTEYSTKFTLEEWVNHIDVFSCWEEERGVETDSEYFSLREHAQDWTNVFESDSDDHIKVHFLSDNCSWYLATYVDTNKKFTWFDRYTEIVGKSLRHYVIVHPEMYSKEKEDFKLVESKLKEKYGRDIFYTVDGFLHHMMDEELKKDVIKENWIAIREKILDKIKIKYPFLIKAKNSEKIQSISETLHQAEVYYNLGEAHHINSVRDSSLACESLLQLIHEIYYQKTHDKDLLFYDLINKLQDQLTTVFGPTIVSDLNYIREQRNKVSHPPITKPTDLETYAVLRKSRLFFEIFQKWIDNIS